MEQRFAELYARTGHAMMSAREAGYGKPAVAVNELMQEPGVLAEAKRVSYRILASEILPLALDRHSQLLKDKDLAGVTLIRAIELAYKYGLTDQPIGDERPASELSPAELADRAERARQTAERIETRLSELARDVSPTDGPREIDAKPDIFS